METNLKIKWPESIEYIRLPDSLRTGALLTTVEDWSEFGVASYRAHVLSYERSLSGGTLELEYLKSDQFDRKVHEYAEELDWGVFKLKWDGHRGTSDYNGKKFKNVTVIEFSEPSPAPRRKRSVLVWDRPEQAALRNWLLTLPRENKCALSGESEPRALEAAHIVPVHKKAWPDSAGWQARWG